MKMTEHAIFLYFFFLVSIANKKKKKQTEENVRLQSTVLHANFFFSFLFEIYLPFFNYFPISKKHCILFSFFSVKYQLIVVFF